MDNFTHPFPRTDGAEESPAYGARVFNNEREAGEWRRDKSIGGFRAEAYRRQVSAAGHGMAVWVVLWWAPEATP